MKSLFKLACVCFGIAGLAGRVGAGIINFDDLAVTPSGGLRIPAGYAGFTWDNFAYETVMNNPGLNPSGYLNGMVSPGNVAFNIVGQPAFISGSAFNLISGYLAGAWDDGLKVEVQGFIGASMTYDNVYTVSSTAPTLVNFNYLGVDQVDFISSGGTAHGYVGAGEEFVLDNLTVTAAPEPSSYALAIVGALVMTVARCRRQPQAIV